MRTIYPKLETDHGRDNSFKAQYMIEASRRPKGKFKIKYIKELRILSYHICKNNLQFVEEIFSSPLILCKSLQSKIEGDHS